tara:strand:- start:2066 stop:2512 length:447 start_codon:yes stop_codon:yes gene_type:complete
MLKKKRKFVGITTLIDKDIVISGDTTYTGGIRIDGVVRGNVKVLGKEESLLIMGYGSEVKGDIDVHKAIINGTINGNIRCLDYLELNADAIVNGNIEYGIIEVHEGAKLNGNLKNKKMIQYKVKPNFKDKLKKNLKKMIKQNTVKSKE